MRFRHIVACCLIAILCITLFARGVTVSATAPPAEMQSHYDSQRSGDYSPAAAAAGTTSGKKLWDLTTFSSVGSSPAVANGIVYVGSDDYNLYALNATTGAQLWYFTTDGSVEADPAVANGVVYIGSDSGNLYALNATDGSLLWNYSAGGPAFIYPAVDNGVVYAAIENFTVANGTNAVNANQKNVSALNSSTGAMIWSHNIGAQGTRPAIVNGVVYIGRYALDASTGDQLWNSTINDTITTGPAVANGIVYVGSNSGYIYALNARDGSEKWGWPTLGPICSSPSIANGVVYVGSDDNNVYALNATTGSELWRYPTRAPAADSASPAIASGVVYVGSDDHNIYALNASTGARLWSYQTGDAVWGSTPAIVNNVMYVGSEDGHFYAIGNPVINAFVDLVPLGWSLFGLAFVGLLIGFLIRFRRRSPHSFRVALLSRSNLSKLKANAFVVATVVWLAVYASLKLEILGSGYITQPIQFAFSWLATIFYVLAIVWIIAHYFPNERPAPLQLGPLFGIVGWVLDTVAFFALLYDPNWSFGLEYLYSGVEKFMLLYIFSLSVVFAPLFIVYLKQRARAPTSVTKAVHTHQFSAALALKSQIEDLGEAVSRVRKWVRRELTVLTFALPIVFIPAIGILYALILYGGPENNLLTTVWAGTGVLFLVVTIRLSFQLRKPRFLVLAVNPSTPNLDQIARAEQRAIANDANQRLAIFLLVFALPAGVGILGFSFAPALALLHRIPFTFLSFILLTGSALACFLVGYWVLIRSNVAVVVVNEDSSQKLLKESVGIFPAKVRAGEAHSILMDFSIGTPTGGAASTEREALAPHADGIQPHYEIELQAAGMTIAGAERCTISEVPAICENIWSCSFPSVGTQALNLLVKEVQPARGEKGEGASYQPVFSYVHPVRVEGNFLSTDNVVPILGVIGALAGVASALLHILH